jgi:hypothetical protein
MTKATRVSADILLAAAAAGALLGAQPVFAQRGGEVTVEVSDCLEIEAPAERLACFERRVDEARGEGEAPAAPPPPAAAAPPPPAAAPAAPAAQTRPAPQAAPTAPAADDSFGRPSPTPSRREQRAAREAQEAEAPVAEIVATIVTVRETVPNYRTITLDNGQIWRQTRSEFYPLQPGLEVRVYPANWGGSFRLTAPRLKGDIQVERLR